MYSGRPLTASFHHAQRIVGEHRLAILVDDAIHRAHQTAAAFRCRTRFDHLAFDVDGVADESGAFHVDGLPEATYTVEFRRDGLETVRKQGVTLRFPFRGIVEVVMKPLPRLPVSSRLQRRTFVSS